MTPSTSKQLRRDVERALAVFRQAAFRKGSALCNSAEYWKRDEELTAADAALYALLVDLPPLPPKVCYKWGEQAAGKVEDMEKQIAQYLVGELDNSDFPYVERWVGDHMTQYHINVQVTLEPA